ncbi:Citreoviridin biosynthesis protein D [Pseudocercospora fuligena]|uniref:Citreoviridin biosynthesis protein D n=1 Tax=Pseudocercospora fuligena TaxID=685502 RepID=A0A8H6VH09_9PEZI|nr:Citreoviridin biosynthesis protein D [Pseudocercospora fuligena]
MSILRILSATILLGVLITAHFALSKQAEWNGTVSLPDVVTYSNTTLPDTDIPIDLPRTGIDGIDNYFRFMTSFFFSTLDSRNIRAHWQGNHLLGTLTSIWMLMLLEAHRKDRSGIFTLVTYFLEVVGELIGIGVATPLWCIIHLLVTLAPTRTNATKVLSTSGRDLKALGWALLFGHVVPTILMLRLEPDGEGIASQQIWTIARLFHPVFVYFFYKIIAVSSGKDRSPARPAVNRSIYTFSILTSAFFHVTSMGFLLAFQMFPGWLKQVVVIELDPKTVLVPVPFWSQEVVSKVPFATGVAIFLQWDYLCSSTAIVIWATSLYLESTWLSLGDSSTLRTLGQAILVAVLAGPGAAAAFLMQERDATLVEVSTVSISGKKVL